MVAIFQQGLVDPVKSSTQIQMFVKENQIFWSSGFPFSETTGYTKEGLSGTEPSGHDQGWTKGQEDLSR